MGRSHAHAYLKFDAQRIALEYLIIIIITSVKEVMFSSALAS